MVHQVKDGEAAVRGGQINDEPRRLGPLGVEGSNIATTTGQHDSGDGTDEAHTKARDGRDVNVEEHSVIQPVHRNIVATPRVWGGSRRVVAVPWVWVGGRRVVAVPWV